LAVPSESNNWAGDNFAGWCFRDADRAIREAVTTLDAAKRQEAYLKQQQLWTQELPSLPLFQRVSATLNAPGISGIQPDALAPITWNVTAWQRNP
jgi:peptide/nickel transport system substrate-binding protein